MTSPRFVIVIFGLSLASSVQSLANDVKGVSLTIQKTGATQTTTFEYESLQPATVFWIGRITERYEATRNVFANGRGVAVTNKTSVDRFAYFMPGGSTFYFVAREQVADDEFQIPSEEFEYTGGDEIVYTPGQPVDVKVRWSKVSNSDFGHIEWYFIGVDPAAHGDTPIFVNSWYPGVDDMVGRLTTTDKGEMFESTVSARLQEQSGLVFFVTTRSVDGYRMVTLNMLPIHAAGKPVFPDNYLEIFIRRERVYCDLSFHCSVPCVALGSDIRTLQLVDDAGTDMDGSFTHHSEWMYVTSYQFPENSQSGTFTCVATNSRGVIKRKTLDVVFYHD